MPPEINIYKPPALGAPMGQYSHVTRVKANEFLFIAGMLAGDAAGNVVGEGDFEAQTAQVFRNIEAALQSAGASWGNVVQFTTYSRAFAGHSEIHGIPAARIPGHVQRRQISAEHAFDGRPA